MEIFSVSGNHSSSACAEKRMLNEIFNKTKQKNKIIMYV